MNFAKLCRDFTIPYSLGSRGWINVKCPHCGDHGTHLGWNTEKEFFSCFKCGSHRTVDTLKKLLNLEPWEARDMMKKYGGAKDRLPDRPKVQPKIRSACKLPYGTKKMGEIHRRYLRGRGFDPEALEKTWDLKGTGGVGEYKFRIIAPVLFDGKMVSYQGRDVTDLQKPKYLSCHDKEAARPLKHCLYGLHLVPTKSIVVITEGVADVWRLGPGAVATFGTAVTREQISLLKEFERRLVFFDPGAEKEATVLAETLSGFPGSTDLLELDEGDPGELHQREADAIMETFFHRNPAQTI
jgi:hypothetical protein